MEMLILEQRRRLQAIGARNFRSARSGSRMVPRHEILAFNCVFLGSIVLIIWVCQMDSCMCFWFRIGFLIVHFCQCIGNKCALLALFLCFSINWVPDHVELKVKGFFIEIDYDFHVCGLLLCRNLLLCLWIYQLSELVNYNATKFYIRFCP